MTNGTDPSRRSADRTDDRAWTAGVAPATDELFRALSDGERRRALYCLLDRDRLDVDGLADEMAGREAALGDVTGPSRRDRLLTRLHHVHLPKLSAVGVLEYDPRAGVVELAALSEAVLDLLRFAGDYDRARGSAV